MAFIMDKSCEEESTLRKPFREPCLVEMGRRSTVEDGLGAGMSIGRHSRVRPLRRFEMYAQVAYMNQGGTTVSFYRPCVCKDDFIFQEEEL